MRTVLLAAVVSLVVSCVPPADPEETDDPATIEQAISSISRVSYADDESQVNDFCSAPAASDDSVHSVVWESTATNLVAGDTNGQRDVFVHDRQTGVTSRVSVSSSGAQATGGRRRPRPGPRRGLRASRPMALPATPTSARRGSTSSSAPTRPTSPAAPGA
jgi:hypothetical protein